MSTYSTYINIYKKYIYRAYWRYIHTHTYIRIYPSSSQHRSPLCGSLRSRRAQQLLRWTSCWGCSGPTPCRTVVMYVCMYVCMYACMNLCKYIYFNMYVYVCIGICSMRVRAIWIVYCIYAMYVCMNSYTCMYSILKKLIPKKYVCNVCAS